MNRTLRVIACIALTGCYSYQLAPLAAIQPKNEVRVTARDGRRVELSGVTVAADTLRGLELRRSGRDTVAVAIADVTKVEVLRHSAGRTVLAVVGVSAIALVGYAALWVSQNGVLGGGSIFSAARR
jgi:hypothetical protein